MKTGIRNAVLSSAVAVTLYGPGMVQARDLVWDPNATATATGSDGSGNWDTTTPIWVDTAAPGLNTTFNNAIPDSARFGTSVNGTGTATPLSILLASNITVLDLTLANSATGSAYNIFDQGDGLQTLTVAGNLLKTGLAGNPQILLTNALVLTSGIHIISAGDSPGDASPELTFNSALTGSGSITINNALGYVGPAADVQYGTTAFNTDNTYTGGTTVSNGRLIANTNGALGTGAVVIDNAGALAFAGGGTTSGNLNIANAVTITRSDYTTANTNNRYQDAIVANNDGTSNTITLNGAITVNSTDARISANSNRIVITQPLVVGATGATSVLDLGGDFNGFIDLTADNSAYGTAGGALQFRNGVEIGVSSEANLGGANSKLLLSGGTIRPTGTLGAPGSPFLTNFGAHNISGAAINTGLNLDNTQTFTVNGLNGTAIGTRGTGTINFNGTNVFTGRPFYDNGVVNINGSTTVGGFALRSATMNIPAGSTLITTSNFSDIGSDSPDNGTLNLAGTLTLANQDFNISDNAGTKGTLNLTGAGVLNSAGRVFAGKANNTVATITQSGTSNVNITSTGVPSLGLGTANGSVGTYTKTSTGVLTSPGETWIGNAVGGTGTFSQSAGTTTVSNWFAIGRGGALGTVNLTGGTLNKNGSNNAYIGESINTVTSTMTVSNNAIFNDTVGEFWVGQGGGSGILTVQDSAQFSVNNWFALGRANGASIGVFNFTGGTFTKTGGGFVAVGSGGQGTFNQSGGTLAANGTRIGEASSGTMNLTGGTSTFTGEFSVGYTAGGVGTLNIGGTANVTVPGAILGVNATVATNGGILNLNGGTLTGASFTAGAAATRLSQFNFNGGTLRPSATNNTNFVGAKVQSNVLAGGALIDTNTFDVTVGSALIHSTVAALDGGVTKSGLGKLTFTGANTYTGATTVANGTVQATSAAYATVLNGANAGLNVQKGKFIFDYTATISPVAQIKTILDAGYAGGFSTGQIRSVGHAAGLTLGYGDDGASKVTVMSTLGGDANLDGTVNFNDFLILQNNFAVAGTRFDQGNFNYDGQTDFNDFLVLQNNFGQSITGEPVLVTRSQIAAITAFANSDASLVPEPGSLSVIAVVASALGGRRRRRTVSAS